MIAPVPVTWMPVPSVGTSISPTVAVSPVPAIRMPVVLPVSVPPVALAPVCVMSSSTTPVVPFCTVVPVMSACPLPWTSTPTAMPLIVRRLAWPVLPDTSTMPRPLPVVSAVSVPPADWASIVAPVPEMAMPMPPEATSIVPTEALSRSLVMVMPAVVLSFRSPP